MIINPEAMQRAERGAELLDRVSPGWHEKIDPDILYMMCTKYCVLGQLYGDFSDGLVALGILDEHEHASVSHPKIADVYAHGWDVELSLPESLYDDLDAAWTDQINKRRASS